MDHDPQNELRYEATGGLICVWVPGADGKLAGRWVPDPQAMVIHIPEAETAGTRVAG